ncbi:hypothetical protein ABVT39_015490 [Epinephelus coioides]
MLEAPKLPSELPPSGLTLGPLFRCTELALAVARQLKITCQDATLVLMTYVSMETRDDRLLEVRVQILRESCDLGDMDGCGKRERRSVRNDKENPPGEREGETSLSDSALYYQSLGNINMPFAIALKSLCH